MVGGDLLDHVPVVELLHEDVATAGGR